MAASRFAHRRAWRILPPYWAALAFSLLIAWSSCRSRTTPAPDAKSSWCTGCCCRTSSAPTTPNGAFWSIAIEAQLYLVFPILLIVVRRAGAAVMLAGMTALVMLVGALAPYVVRCGPVDAAHPAVRGAVRARRGGGRDPAGVERWRRLPWPWLALGAAVPVLV